MEVKHNFQYSLWHHGSPNTSCRELENASASCPPTEEGTLSWKQPDQELLQMVADDENAFSRSNITSSNSGFIFTAFVKQDGSIPSPKFCLASGKSWQYGSLEGESHAVVITSLFRKPLLNLSDLRVAFDVTSGEIFDDTSAGSSEGGCCRCLRPFLMEVSDLLNYLCCTPVMVSDHRRKQAYEVAYLPSNPPCYSAPTGRVKAEEEDNMDRSTLLDSQKVKRQFVNLISTSFSSV